MTELRLHASVLVGVALAGVPLAAGCSGGDGADQSRPASQAQGGAEAEREDANGESVTGDGADGKDGARGEDGSSQSSSIVQSSESGAGSTSSSSSQTSSSGKGVKTFSGTGATTLSFNVETPSRLAWTDSKGKPFSAKGAGIAISSREGRGEIPLAPDGYTGVKVRGSNWTIVVRPR